MVAPARTREELIELWSRVLSDGYTAPILDQDNVGRDVPEMAAEQLACLDEAIVDMTQSYYLKTHSDQLGPPATGAVRATGTAEVKRLGTAEGVAVVLEGTELEALIVDSMGVTRSNGVYEIAEDLSFSAGESGPLTAQVRAKVPGTGGNLVADSVEQFVLVREAIVHVDILDDETLEDVTVPGAFRDIFTEAMVGRFIVFDNSPEAEMYPRRITAFNEGGTGNQVTITPALPATVVGQTGVIVRVANPQDLFEVDSSSAMTGGKDGFLDAIGRDRNAPRQANESDESYRQRLCTLGDIVSPNAMCRIASAVLSESGCPFLIAEYRGSGFEGFTYTETIGGAPSQADKAFKFWDAAEATLLSGATWGVNGPYFAIVIGPCTVDFRGFPYDATSPPRPNAYDEAAYDVGDVGLGPILGALHNQIDAARAGGVAFEILFDENQKTQQCITA